MRIQIDHTTRYVYARAVHFGQHRLVLRPREGHDLRVERFELQSFRPTVTSLGGRDGHRLAPDEALEFVKHTGVRPIVLVTLSGDLLVRAPAPQA